MTKNDGLTDTIVLKVLAEERRGVPRFACHAKVLYSRRGDGENILRGEATWNIGRIVDVSRNGLALVIRGRYVPGTVLSLEPLVSRWQPGRDLTARVTNMRPGPGTGWCLGCQLTRALTGDELQALLLNVG
jgi:hypothetical protein